MQTCDRQRSYRYASTRALSFHKLSLSIIGGKWLDMTAGPPYIPPEPAFGLKEEMPMAWTTPSIIEICIGLEINGYLPAEF
jgi:coenzyme PQQ precursor peptide PqqA